MPHVDEWDAQEREHCRLDMHRIAEIPRAIDQDTARAAWFRKWGTKLDADLISGRGDLEIEDSLEQAETELNDAMAEIEVLTGAVKALITELDNLPDRSERLENAIGALENVL